MRKVYSNVSSVLWNSLPITGVEEITLAQADSRVAGGADDDIHESYQFIGIRTTQITMAMTEAPPFALPTTNAGAANMATLSWTVPGRQGTASKTYSIINVQWFDAPTNGAFGALRKWNLTGHAIVTNSGDPTPVTIS